MIGKHVLEIGSTDWIKGMSEGDDISNGGFSNLSDQVNIATVPGVLYAPATVVDSDTDTRLTAGIIASCPDMNVISPDKRLVVTSDGKGYRYDGTKLTAAGIALTAGKTWTSGFTDMVTFAGEAYISSKESITRWQNDNTIDAGASWPVTFTNSNVPHPGLIYQDRMYWADKNLLLIQSTIGDAVAPTTILTLSADQVIIALGIDPGTGLMLISTSNVLDMSATVTTTPRLILYDGNSPTYLKSSIVDDVILGFHSVGGNVFVGYGKKIGYLTGSGIGFLQGLKNATLSNDDLPYKHHFTSIGNTLYVIDGKQIMAYGDVLPGQKVFYYAQSNAVNSNKYTAIFDAGSGKIGYAFATTKFYTMDTTSVATTSGMTFFTNKYSFPRPVIINGIYIEYADAVANNEDNRNLFYQSEDKQTGFQILNVVNGTHLKNTSGANVYFIDNIGGFLNNKLRMLQFRYNATGNNYGLKRILVYYTPAE